MNSREERKMNDTRPTIIAITDMEMDMEDLSKSLSNERTGAVVIFTGIVRGVTGGYHGRKTERLVYEAYQPMAEEKMNQVASEIRDRWPQVEGIAIIQRIGTLEAGTATTIVACSAAHRNTGVFEAARYGIDRLKEIVPVWKKEIRAGGEEWVEGHYHPKPGE